jgi:hypothetical protein
MTPTQLFPLQRAYLNRYTRALRFILSKDYNWLDGPGSIPDSVRFSLQAGRLWVRVPMTLLDFFDSPNTSSRTTALRSTRPLTEMSTKNLPGVKGGRRLRLTISPPSVS